MTRNPSMFGTKGRGVTRNPNMFGTKGRGVTRNPSMFGTKGRGRGILYAGGKPLTDYVSNVSHLAVSLYAGGKVAWKTGSIPNTFEGER